MKKIGLIGVMLVFLLNSFVYANPVVVGDYDASVFTMFERQIGKNGSFALGFVLTIIMCAITLIIIYRAFDIKNKPENLKRLKITFTFVMLLFIGGLALLGGQKYNAEHRWNIVSMPEIPNRDLFNQALFVYFSKRTTSQQVSNLVDKVNAINQTSNDHNVSIVTNEIIEFDEIAKQYLFTPIKNTYYKIDCKEFDNFGYISTLEISVVRLDDEEK